MSPSLSKSAMAAPWKRYCLQSPMPAKRFKFKPAFILKQVVSYLDRIINADVFFKSFFEHFGAGTVLCAFAWT
jgi:hypothetical protein